MARKSTVTGSLLTLTSLSIYSHASHVSISSNPSHVSHVSHVWEIVAAHCTYLQNPHGSRRLEETNTTRRDAQMV
jgi:hypothetical protein